MYISFSCTLEASRPCTYILLVEDRNTNKEEI